jgi:hypothetical protein
MFINVVSWPVARKSRRKEITNLELSRAPRARSDWRFEGTLRNLRQQIEAAIQGTDRAEESIEAYHGPTPQARRVG